jgi:3-carboxy-cis,cis-muconate cycloisomerase
MACGIARAVRAVLRALVAIAIVINRLTAPSHTTLDCELLRDLFGAAQMRELFSTRSMVQAWLDAESALAHAEADVGLIPRQAAQRIDEEAQADRFDMASLRRGIAESQHPLVPLIRALSDRCGSHGGYVHWGATTQDIIDTGLVLQIRRGLEVLDGLLAQAIDASLALSQRHRQTIMAGRTHGQHAVPITLGLKVAGWTDELLRARQRLHDGRDVVLTAQLGGGAGTLASLGPDAEAVSDAFAARLDLRKPASPWFTARDRVRDLAHDISQFSAAAERIAAEVIRLQATEVAEVAEPLDDGHVGSSTMPQKRNPMICEYLVASSRLLRASASAVFEAVAHAGERDMALWATEWLAVPQMFILAGGVGEKLVHVLGNLEVDELRMRKNIELSGGALMAEAAMMLLSRTVGREQAHAVVMAAARRAQREGRDLLVVLAEQEEVTAHLSAEELARLRAPESYTGWSADVVERLDLAAARGLVGR